MARADFGKWVVWCGVLGWASGCNAVLENDARFLELDGNWDLAVDAGLTVDASGPVGGDASESVGTDDGAATGIDDASDADNDGDVGTGGSGAGGNSGGPVSAGGAGGDAGRSGASTGGGGSGGGPNGGGGNAGNGMNGGAAGTGGDVVHMSDAAIHDARAVDATVIDSGPPDPCQLSTRACNANQVGTDSKACGNCNTGTQSRTRKCATDCTWGAWSAYSACQGGGVCAAGATQTRNVSCSCGDTKGQKQTCSNSCAWGAWTDTSKCNLACCTKLVYCDTPDDLSGVPASRGTWCQQQSSACTHAEVQTHCTELLDSKGCTLQEVFYMDWL